jgi:hypothetical protein
MLMTEPMEPAELGIAELKKSRPKKGRELEPEEA